MSPGLRFATGWRARHADRIADVLRTKGRSFAFAARFLDPERRRATEVLYAFVRSLDDLVDEPPPGTSAVVIGSDLERWDRWLAASHPASREGDDPLAAAVAEVIAAYAIPPVYLRALVRGLRDDLDGRPIETFDDLERYAFRVAGSVGLAMCHILGASGPRALRAAAALGIAMQLTNIVRDVGEDLDRGRIYLPAEDLARWVGSMRDLRERRVGAPLRAVLGCQVARARRYYTAGLAGIDDLPPEGRYSIALAAGLYGRILDTIQARRYDVFAGRAVVGRPAKIVLAGRLAVAKWTGHGWPPRGATRQILRSTPADCLGPGARAELAACGIPCCVSDG